MPKTTATPSAAASPAKPATGTSRRRFGSKRRGGGGASARTRSRSASAATGRPARSSCASFSKRSSTSSSGDTGAHLPFQLLQGAAETRRARGPADPEHAARAFAVELEDDPKRQHFTLCGRQPRQRRLERGREAFAEAGLLRLGHSDRIAPFTPSTAVLGAKVVERRRPSQLAEPGARAPAARIEASPALASSGE